MERQLGYLRQDIETLEKDTTHLQNLNINNIEGLGLTPPGYGNLKYYDSIQNALPVKERDGWIKRRAQRKIIELQTKFGNNKKMRYWNVFLKSSNIHFPRYFLCRYLFLPYS